MMRELLALGVIMAFAIIPAYGKGHGSDWSDSELIVISGSVLMNIALATVTIIQILIYRSEIRQRLRPWVGRDGRVDMHEDPTTGQRMIRVPLHNHGAMPALGIIITKHYISTDAPEKNIFNNEEPDDPLDLLPDESFTYSIPMSAELYTAAQSGVIHYGIRLKYTGKNGIKGMYQITGKFIHGTESGSMIKVK